MDAPSPFAPTGPLRNRRPRTLPQGGDRRVRFDLTQLLLAGGTELVKLSLQPFGVGFGAFRTGGGGLLTDGLGAGLLGVLLSPAPLGVELVDLAAGFCQLGAFGA
ncbi:hypothetical protein ABZ793_34540 [Micromonospora sp. NPDC047465]|uniref:hypothetical protein n=1 Tax=Micromonospora sp. NPDC047465 TaxID=3154813 RepID=UPI0033D438E5